MTRLLVVTSARQMLLLAAAIDHGALRDDARELVVVLADLVDVPEVGPSLERSAALGALERRGARTVSWTATVAPLLPATFLPRVVEQPVWERLLRERWGLDDGPVDLAAADLSSGPGRALARVFPHARITVLADELVRWAPIDERLRGGVARRLDVLLAPELLPGLVPHLLAEHGTRVVMLPSGRLAAVVEQVARSLPGAHAHAVPHATGGHALLLGDAPGALRTAGEHGAGGADRAAGAPRAEPDGDLVGRIARAAAREVRAAGLATVVVAAHPLAPARHVRTTTATLRDEGLTVRLADPDVPTEVLVVRDRPGLVLGTASTGLLTALALGAADVRAVGTHDALASLRPYGHPARTALTMTDALLAPDAGPVPGRTAVDGRSSLGASAAGSLPAGPSSADVVRLLDAVTYCMRPERVPHLRPAAVALLLERSEPGTDGRPAWQRWVHRRRAEKLGLLGPPSQTDDDVPGVVRGGPAPRTTPRTGATPRPGTTPTPVRGVRSVLRALRTGP